MVASWVCLALSCLAFAGLVEGANLRAGSCDYNGKTYWGGQTIESMPEQCTELKCKWSADGNPTVQLMPIDGCTCTTSRALLSQDEAEDVESLSLPHAPQTRQTKSQCLYNGQLKWGGAVVDRIDANPYRWSARASAARRTLWGRRVSQAAPCTQQVHNYEYECNYIRNIYNSCINTASTASSTTGASTTSSTTAASTASSTTAAPTTTTEDYTVKGCKEETTTEEPTTEAPTTTVSVTDTTQACAGTDSVTS
ncbi:uncharacterized protein LOC122267210 [Penaeus japonicus]|uniref:uncharacterized protein LOC122267210 n=1 Tax=Penaeus japonicus TaxID=27405 RepID=UPI001C713964|nr:uncharacterized protein LOC122267210 [Penaeus japonicus]